MQNKVQKWFFATKIDWKFLLNVPVVSREGWSGGSLATVIMISCLLGDSSDGFDASTYSEWSHGLQEKCQTATLSKNNG